MSKSVLVVDDDLMMLDAIQTILGEMGYRVDTCSRSSEGEESALENDYDLILMDIHMPERTGDQVTRAILNRKPNAKILVITAHPNDPLAANALNAGAKGLVKKPFEIGKILEFLKD
ncbi:MAG: response regulator [Spirochaetaceae bacterium]|nr:response regulator [Spirochaetaceae bacterium]